MEPWERDEALQRQIDRQLIFSGHLASLMLSGMAATLFMFAVTFWAIADQPDRTGAFICVGIFLIGAARLGWMARQLKREVDELERIIALGEDQA